MSEPETKKPKVDEGAPVKKAIITGITGQDGSYLAEFLLEKVRYSSFEVRDEMMKLLVIQRTCHVFCPPIAQRLPVDVAVAMRGHANQRV